MRSLREVLLIVAGAGGLGFLGCIVVGIAADRRLDAHPLYSQPNNERTVAIRTKYHEGFVEPDYAQRFDRSETWSLYFWIMGLIGSLGWFVLRQNGSKNS